MTDTHPDPSSDETAFEAWKNVARDFLIASGLGNSHVAALREAFLAGRHSIASGEGVGVGLALGSPQRDALLQRIDAALGGLEPLTGQSEDYIWRPANRTWEALVAAKNALPGKNAEGDEE